jgi:hypothetical protein
MRTQQILPAFVFLMSCFSAAQSQPVLESQRTRLTLMSAVSSKLPKDSPFTAKLDQPVQIDGQVLLPQGTVFQGHVDPTPARRMVRAGALRLVFDRLVLPDGSVRTTKLSLTSIDCRKVKTDAEGKIRPRLSKKRLLFQVGGAALIAKVSDDLSEVAAASVTKNSARFFGLAGAAAFLLLQKGGEVKVPEGTGIEVMVGRDGEVLPLGVALPSASSSPPH